MATTHPDWATQAALEALFSGTGLSFREARYAPSRKAAAAFLSALAKMGQQPALVVATGQTRHILGEAFERLTRMVGRPLALVLNADLHGVDINDALRMREFLENKLDFSRKLSPYLPGRLLSESRNTLIQEIKDDSGDGCFVHGLPQAIYPIIMYVNTESYSAANVVSRDFHLPLSAVEGQLPPQFETLTFCLAHEIGHIHGLTEGGADAFAGLDYFHHHPHQRRAAPGTAMSAPHLFRLCRAAALIFDPGLPDKYAETVGVSLPGDTIPAMKGMEYWRDCATSLRGAIDSKLGLSDTFSNDDIRQLLSPSGDRERTIGVAHRNADIRCGNGIDVTGHDEIMSFIVASQTRPVEDIWISPDSIVRQSFAQTRNADERARDPVRVLNAVRELLAEGRLPEPGTRHIAALFVEGMERFFPHTVGVGSAPVTGYLVPNSRSPASPRPGTI